ncbi:MAG: hypothetical protein U0746_22145 [Gemmataceae bacterium]
MATGELVRREVERGRAAYWTFGVLTIVGLAIVLFGLRRPPQMGADERVFGTVDALYTAVRMHDVGKVAQCESRLHGYRDGAQLPAAAATFLDGVIASAHRGDWASAAERLYGFMAAQRREGEIAPKPRGNAKK